ncbi:MAG: SecD/SecF family protein translocase subunit, partial [Ruaniaceae bacterium]|nr:SecD/SecF family protein translocase subunit [Ruaniaceae bacterium]
GLVVSNPGIDERISGGNPSISGSGIDRESAATLANQLQFGSLPLNFTVQSEEQLSATLGVQQLRVGITAGLVGLALVIIYMLFQYHALAFVTLLSLGIAGVLTYLTITLLSWTIGYRLSLAGVAGLIIAIGITADSFIVYFERIRDEVRDGRRLEDAVEYGWHRARRTIFASDGINFLAAIVLYMLAVGSVRGFAFTLGLTTLIDLLVVMVFTYPLMTLLVRTNYFGQGKKFSGLDPVHLGANTASYRGRLSFGPPGAKSGEGKKLSIAERKAAETAEKEVVEL